MRLKLVVVGAIGAALLCFSLFLVFREKQGKPIFQSLKDVQVTAKDVEISTTSASAEEKA